MLLLLMQDVRKACVAKGAADVLVLPLDLTGSFDQLEAAAAAADEAFGGAGVDYLIQNAGGREGEGVHLGRGLRQGAEFQGGDAHNPQGSVERVGGEGGKGRRGGWKG